MRTRLALPLAAVLTVAVSSPAYALLELRFVEPPALPAMPGVKLNAKSQIDSTAMTNFSLEQLTLSKAGWNITAQGQSDAGDSPVFSQYCAEAACGTVGYVPGGFSLPADSLTLETGGASFSGGLGTAPVFECSSACDIDSPTPVKIASQGTGLLSGEGLWVTQGFSASSLKLAVPATLRALPAGEVYRANILWTLSTGP
jgi:hypothetical protein